MVSQLVLEPSVHTVRPSTVVQATAPEREHTVVPLTDAQLSDSAWRVRAEDKRQRNAKAGSNIETESLGMEILQVPTA